ncbi:MAG TPA: AIR synthase-related protein [Dehalococcoidia bacterium]|nr:AIR synthase-related protein [Dehalococcoidia bacterium]
MNFDAALKVADAVLYEGYALYPYRSSSIEEAAVPVRGQVRGACEILGIDPIYVANEGKLIAVVAPERAADVLEAMHRHPRGEQAAIIGEVRAEPAGRVLLQTPYGGARVMDMLVGDPTPRIC